MLKRIASLALVAIVLVACGEPQPPVDDKPSAPSDITTSVEHGIITVAWSHDGENTTGYRILRESVGVSNFVSQQATQIAEVGADERSYIDRSAVIGAEYAYQVVAFGPNGASQEGEGQTPVTVDPGITMRVGTYMYPLIEDPLLAVGFFVYLSDAQIAAMEAPATATIAGPATWNGGAPLAIQLAAEALERGFVWYAPNAAVTGTYQLEVDIGASTYTSTASLDSLETLAYPSGITVDGFDATSVSGSWDAHPDAASYTVTLYRGQHNSPTAVASAHTVDTQHTFSGLDLEPDDYFFAVYVFEIDRTDPLRLQPPERFDASLNATDLFQLE